MAVNNARKVRAEERRHRVLQLKIGGASLEAIASQVGVVKQQVHKDLKQRLSELAQRDKEGADAMRALQLARYERMLVPLWPLVIQLDAYGNEEQRTKGEDSVSDSVRWSVFKRDGYACVLCSKDSDLTIDHLQPQSKGGEDDEANLQTLCRACNSAKGATGVTLPNSVRLNALAFDQVMRILERIDRICGVIPDKPLIGNLAINQDNRQVNVFRVTFDGDDDSR